MLYQLGYARRIRVRNWDDQHNPLKPPNSAPSKTLNDSGRFEENSIGRSNLNRSAGHREVEHAPTATRCQAVWLLKVKQRISQIDTIWRS
jgi:hypothetical protein